MATSANGTACSLTGSCSLKPASMYRSRDAQSAGSSANLATGTGVQPFNVLPYTSSVSYDAEGQVVPDLSCVNCSDVDQDTFNRQCIADANLGAARMRYAACAGQRGHFDINNGNRRIDNIDSRTGVQRNLTNVANVDSSEGKPVTVRSAPAPAPVPMPAPSVIDAPAPVVMQAPAPVMVEPIAPANGVAPANGNKLDMPAMPASGAQLARARAGRKWLPTPMHGKGRMGNPLEPW